MLHTSKLQCGDDISVKVSNRIFDGAEYSPTKITFRSLDGIMLRQENLNSSVWSSWCRIPNDVDPVIRVTVEYVECGRFVQRVPEKGTVELEMSTCIGSDKGICWSTKKAAEYSLALEQFTYIVEWLIFAFFIRMMLIL